MVVNRALRAALLPGSVLNVNASFTTQLAFQAKANVIAFCQFVCPNRWWFRYAFDFFAFMLLAYLAAAYIFIDLQTFMKRLLKRRYALALLTYAFGTTLILCASLYCDPYWQDKREIVFVIIAGFLFASRYLNAGMAQSREDYP